MKPGWIIIAAENATRQEMDNVRAEWEAAVREGRMSMTLPKGWRVEPFGLAERTVYYPPPVGPTWAGAAILIVFIALALGGLAAIGVASVIAGAC